MGIMFRGLVLTLALTTALCAQKTEVANGYHVVHLDKPEATAPSSSDKTAKATTKKTTKKSHARIKSIVPGK